MDLIFFQPMLYKSLFFPLLAVLLVFLPACANDKSDSGRYVPEVLLASECGFDGLKCCADAPICFYGQQCCQDPDGSGKNYCASDCSCGDNGEFCCSGGRCAGKGICQEGICLACGGESQLCCQAGQECLAGLACQAGKCAFCGTEGGPCCPGAEKCPSAAGQKAECLDNICRKCGFDGNRPCQEGERCLPGQLFAGKTCERCGGSNQPCCAKEAAGYDCDPVKGLKCELGFCGKK